DDHNHVKSVLTNLLNIRNRVSKEYNQYSCENYSHNSKFQILNEKVQEKFLIKYSKDFESILCNIHSSDRYESYNK
ncbi:hypothetical protein C922_05410, partial [Plasmodium inui San Antonio 1]